jgi:histone H3/H4
MPGFPLSVMDRVIRKTGKVRVSRGAAMELSAILEAYAMDLAKEAVKLAEHRGAKTVSDVDVRAAASRMRM